MSKNEKKRKDGRDEYVRDSEGLTAEEALDELDDDFAVEASEESEGDESEEEWDEEEVENGEDEEVEEDEDEDDEEDEEVEEDEEEWDDEDDEEEDEDENDGVAVSGEDTSEYEVAETKKKSSKKEKKPTDKLADKTRTEKILTGIFGDPAKKNLKRMFRRVLEINKLESFYEEMSDEELAGQTEVLKKRLDKLMKKSQAEKAAKKLKEEKVEKDEATLENVVEKKKTKRKARHFAHGADIESAMNKILPDAFALVREATKRVLGMRHYDVQMVGGIALHEGNVAEMKTGEGKTLVALLPAYLNGLTGRGVHVVTVNDYLAQRDAGWNGPVYDFLGMSVSVIINEASFIYDAEYENTEHEDERFRHLKPCTRKEAYAADVTYGTNNEFGFDYLRDNMVSEAKFLRQRELNFAIVDEVDSILIDEARTPLIISAPAGDNPASYYQFAKIAATLIPDDYVLDEKHRSVTLTEQGVDKVEKALGISDLYSVKHTRMVYHLNQALRAQVIFKRDKDYVVTNSG
ncbi:MAG: hypothetical protein Q4F60_03190, partial [Candidatus Saccharibacteria bacterium]|nr:hypothetical protein [Candidatus Saccharibacteria bacterium]